MSGELLPASFEFSPPVVRRAPESLVLEAPRRATGMILSRLAPVFLPPGRQLYVVDGANCFDPYTFAIEARRRALREDVIDRVFVTRCFTIHQLAGVTHEMLTPTVRHDPGAAVAVLGLDHLFLEESLRAVERARVLGGVMSDLAGLCAATGVRLLVTHEAVPPAMAMWRPMLAFGDVRLRVRGENDGAWNLEIERYDDGANPAYLQHLAAGGDRVVEGFSPGP